MPAISPKTKKTKPKKPNNMISESRIEEYLKSKITNDSYRQGSHLYSASIGEQIDSKEDKQDYK